MGDQDVGERAVILVDADFGDGLQVWHARDNMAEDGVFGVEVGAGGEGDEESEVRRVISGLA